MSRIAAPTNEPVEIHKRQSFTPAQRLRVMERQGGLCAACGEPLQPGFQIDHVTPLAMGGLHEMANWEALCPEDHLVKTRKDVKAIAKAKRLAGETGQGPKRPIPNRGFDKTRRKRMDGTVEVKR